MELRHVKPTGKELNDYYRDWERLLKVVDGYRSNDYQCTAGHIHHRLYAACRCEEKRAVLDSTEED